MSNKYRNLWVFGDSYSTPNICVDVKDSFWFLTAQALGAETVYNYSWPSNSFDSVLHLVTSESEKYDWERDFFIIGIPPLTRLTVVSKDSTRAYHCRLFAQDGKEIEQHMILSHHGLQNLSFYKDPTAIRFEDPAWTEIQALRSIFLLNAWLDSKRANYLIINLSKNFLQDEASTGKFLMNQGFNHPRNIIVGDTYYNINLNINKPTDFDEYGWNGHHGAKGNRYFFENSLKLKLM